jgi:phospholipid/cholesterol/gamma-HCH transport system substrate-binding protein
MESRSHALIAGFFTIALLVIATAVGLWLSKDDIQRTPYVISTNLSVSGLNVQGAVRYKGLKVGKVTDISFNDKEPGQLLISIEIIKDTPVTKSSFATLGYQGVTGIASVDLDDDGSQPTLLTANGGQAPRIPLRPGLFQNLEKRGIAILAQTEELGTRLNQLLDAKNQQSLVTTVNSINDAAQAWKTVPDQINPAISKFSRMADAMSNSATTFQIFAEESRATSRNFLRLSDELLAKDGAISQLKDTLNTVSAHVTSETLPGIHGLTKEAQATLRTINRTTESLSERPQSLLFGGQATPPGPGEPGFVAPK